MRTAFFILLTAALPGLSHVIAQTYSPVGARSAALANASVTLTDLWSVNNNQSALAGISQVTAGLSYENRFLVQELGLKTFALAIPTKTGTFGLLYNSFGYSAYNQMKAGLAFGKKFGKIFSAGIQLDYLRTHIAESYGNQDAFTFEAGILTSLTKQFTIAAHVFNPIHVQIQPETNDRVPVVFKLGMAYKVAEALLFTIETEKNSDFKPLMRGGIEYAIIEKAAVRIGYSTLPSTSGSDGFSIASALSFGFGLNLRNFLLDLSSSYHQALGWSPAVSMVYNFRKAEK